MKKVSWDRLGRNIPFTWKAYELSLLKQTDNRLIGGRPYIRTVKQLCLGVTQNMKLAESERVAQLKLQFLLHRRLGDLGAIGICREASNDFWRDG